jgi:F5/8 type C domain
MKKFNARIRHLAPVLFPFAVILVGIAPHFKKLGDHLVASHEYWYDGLIHMYLSWERFSALKFDHGFFDYKWFAPYSSTGTYNEPGLTNGILFGLFNMITPGEVWAFNLSMIAILALNCFALYLLIKDFVHNRWVAAIFATVGALCPFSWVRYFHPANTIIFWGLLGLLFLRLAVREPTWRRCLAAPAFFVAQLFSSLYTGMFFLVPLILLAPMAVAQAHVRGILKKFCLRIGVAILVMLPFLAGLQLAYVNTRDELGRENTYAYVSMWMERGTQDMVPRAPLTCRLRTLGLVEDQDDCRDEMFPGGLVLVCSMLGLLAAFVVASGKKRRSRYWIFRVAFVATGLGAALLSGYTFPLHMGIWLALCWPLWRPDKWAGVHNPMAVYAAVSLFIVDVALNPVVNIGVELASIYQLFFYAVPGFDGLRSEYRIVVLLPVFLSVVGAIAVRYLLSLAALRKWHHGRTAIFVLLGAWAVFDAQPAWQEYKPAPRTDRRTPVLEAAAALPQDAVLAIVKGKGKTIVRRLEDDGAYWDAYVMIHGHRQITNKSTYKAPASESIQRSVVRLRDRAARLPWAMRLAYLFGGTHMIIDWRGARAPSSEVVKKMLPKDAVTSILKRDEHMVLVEIAKFPKTAHGPVPAAKVDGDVVAASWKVQSSSQWSKNPNENSVDGDFKTRWSTSRPMDTDDWISFEVQKAVCVSAIGFAPGLAIERHPTSYVVEVEEDGSWRTAAEQDNWEIPQTLVDRPGSGLVNVSFEPVRTKRIRIRSTCKTPWPWSVAAFVAYGGSCSW